MCYTWTKKLDGGAKNSPARTTDEKNRMWNRGAKNWPAQLNGKNRNAKAGRAREENRNRSCRKIVEATMAVKGRHSTTTTPEQTRKSKTKSRNIPGMVRSRFRASGGRRHGRGWVVFYEKEVRDDVPNDRFSEKSERFGDSENRPLFFDRGRVRICHHVHFYVFPVLADTSPIQIRRKLRPLNGSWSFFALLFSVDIYLYREDRYLFREDCFLSVN